MAKVATVSVDVTKLTKSKLFKGKKGTYANLVIFFNDSPDQFGNDFSVAESLSKEEREAGEKTVYVGNGKYTGSDAKLSTSEESELGF